MVFVRPLKRHVADGRQAGTAGQASSGTRRSDHWAAQAFTDRTLNAYGAAVCKLTIEEMERYQSKGWVLRQLPKKWLQQ